MVTQSFSIFTTDASWYKGFLEGMFKQYLNKCVTFLLPPGIKGLKSLTMMKLSELVMF